jgi:uncharacterized protein YbjT (DUF2867 family)
MNNKTVIVAGSSGLIGSEAVKQLIQDPDYSNIILLVRKKSGINHGKVKEYLFDFSHTEYTLDNIQADRLIICIGTTMKKAKTKEQFKEVDLDIPIKLGRMAKIMGIDHVLVISSMGADSKSMFFYNRVKGEMEKELISLQLHNLTILRPSLLIGEREEFRLGERLAEKMFYSIPFIFPKKYKPIPASNVAKLMIKKETEASNGNVTIIENQRIHEMSRNI